MTATRHNPQADHTIEYILQPPPLPGGADRSASIVAYEEAVADEFMRDYKGANVRVSVSEDVDKDGVSIVPISYPLSRSQCDTLARGALISRYDNAGNIVPENVWHAAPDARAIIERVLQRPDWVQPPAPLVE